MILEKKFGMYVNIENKVFGRKPTKSNIAKTKSDNSLYWGMYNDDLSRFIRDFFCLSSNEEFSTFELSYNDKIVVLKNDINDYGQFQSKYIIDKKTSGISIMANDFIEKSKIDIIDNEYFIFTDLINKKVFFSLIKQIDENHIELPNNEDYFMLDDRSILEIDRIYDYLEQNDLSKYERVMSFSLLLRLQFSSYKALYDYIGAANGYCCGICKNKDNLLIGFKSLNQKDYQKQLFKSNMGLFCPKHFSIFNEGGE